MSELHLENIPGLPQKQIISAIAPAIWRNGEVVALWIGGSLARSAGDKYSDIDLRVAVSPSSLDNWKAPDFDTLLPLPVAGKSFLPGKDVYLHHILLAKGAILDLLIQNTEHSLLHESVLVLGCRDAAFAEKLDSTSRQPPQPGSPVQKELVLKLLTDFWINSHKHRKVLYRNLDLLVPTGIQAERMLLLRLWYFAATGEDSSEQFLRGIHGLSRIVRVVDEYAGSEARALLGASLVTRDESYATIEKHRVVVAQLGRELAHRFGFDYPAALEQTVRDGWQRFLNGDDE